VNTNTNNGVKWRRFIVPKKVEQITDHLFIDTYKWQRELLSRLYNVVHQVHHWLPQREKCQRRNDFSRHNNSHRPIVHFRRPNQSGEGFLSSWSWRLINAFSDAPDNLGNIYIYIYIERERERERSTTGYSDCTGERWTLGRAAAASARGAAGNH